MLSLLYTLVKYALEYRVPTKDDTVDMNTVIARIENANKLNAPPSCENEHFEADDCQYATGNVTLIATDYILIDNRYICDIVNVSVRDLKVGDKVHYVAFPKGHEKEHKVRKIISAIDESWDNLITESQTNIKQPEALRKTIIGKVTERKKRRIFIEPNNISIDLNKVQSEFIPIVGDWLKLESISEINEDSVDLSGKVLEISKIQPLRSKLDVGIISSYDPAKEIGTIGNSIIFSKEICDSGYIPRIGDKVISDSIESDQGLCTWRSLTVVPIVQVSEKQQLPILCTTQLPKKNLNELVKNKCGIIITDNLNIDLNVQEEKNVIIRIQNVGNATHVLRKSCFMSKKAQSQLALIEPITFDTALVINPLDTVSFVFKCTAKFVGVSEELFIFNFQGFHIGRIFRITVKSKKMLNETCPREDRNRKQNMLELDKPDQMTYIPGIRPYKPPPFIKVRNVIFRVPRHYWDLVLQITNEGKSLIECEQDIGNAIPCLVNRLCINTYKERFHALLYLEEIAQTINMQQYNMESATMRHSGEFLAMQVPGLAEKRPSLLVGDRAIVSFKWDNSQGKLKYEGFIHKVTSSEIFLKFNPQFHQRYNSEDCEVKFKCSYSSIQRCHNAINNAVNRLGVNFLFPTHVIEKEAQLNLEETEVKNDSNHVKCTHHRTDSVSSESSCTSVTSFSNKSSTGTTKSSTRVTVIERLFNVKPTARNPEVIKNSVTSPINNKCTEKSVPNSTMHNGSNTTAVTSTSENITQSEAQNNTELGSYISQIKKRKLIWYNKHLNEYQKEAVRNILKGYARPLPYIIFGPPGTGKTVTLCETILQILSTIPESRILIATPSNSSANLITERLLESGILKPGDMVRLIAHHCLGSDSIPEKLLPYCAIADLAAEGTNERKKYNDIGLKINCTMSVLGRHRITIGTCIALGILYNMGFPHGHFSHVLVDEAGQATEPEIMIPLNFIHADYGQVVLAGDPLQLGPVVQSRLAKNFGLDESFLSRLLRHFPYQRDPDGFKTKYDPRVVTKLVMNYRSLPEILQLSSTLFYDSELQPQISSKHSEEANLLQKLAMELPERDGSPPAIIFHGVIGENCRDGDSPSWYNPEEATQVYLYLLKLYKCGISADDIGVITPYQKQVHQIREILLELDVKLPKISSVEGFQGQERKVIIVSAVRSSNDFVNEDIKHSLGFVACPRRLNVAITRARALLIILGNPRLLSQDPYWRSVLIYCNDRGTYTGCTFYSSNVEDSLTGADDILVNGEINNL